MDRHLSFDVVHGPFVRPGNSLESDFEDKPGDQSVLPCKWSREWVGAGDWYATKEGIAWCSSAPESMTAVHRWVAKTKDIQIVDGSMIKGRWWNKYMELSSTRGSMGRDLTTADGTVLYHREVQVHWVFEVQIFFKRGSEPWTRQMEQTRNARKKARADDRARDEPDDRPREPTTPKQIRSV